MARMLVCNRMNISHKLVVPTLQSSCLTFLLTHAGAKPIKAMRIAELFDEEELYREASRFVLDNPGDAILLAFVLISSDVLPPTGGWYACEALDP